MFGRWDTRHAKDRGAALVETALILVLVLLLVAGMADLGLALNAYVIIGEASREGARYASLHPHLTDEGSIKQAAKLMAERNGLTIAEENVAVDGLEGAPGTPIRVTVTYSMTTVLLGTIYQLMELSPLNAIPMTYTTEMMIVGN